MDLANSNIADRFVSVNLAWYICRNVKYNLESWRWGVNRLKLSSERENSKKVMAITSPSI